MQRLEIIGTIASDPRNVVINGSTYVSYSVAVRRDRDHTEWYEIMMADSRFHNYFQWIAKGVRVFAAGNPSFSCYLSKKDDLWKCKPSIYVNDFEVVKFADEVRQDRPQQQAAQQPQQEYQPKGILATAAQQAAQPQPKQEPTPPARPAPQPAIEFTEPADDLPF